MKKMTLKPIPEGDEHGGDHAIYEEEGGQPVGFIPHAELSEYAARHLGVNPDVEEDADESDASPEGTGDGGLRIAAREAERRMVFLREAVHKGKIDPQRATRLAENGSITLAEYIRAQEAERLIDGAIARGKILPRERSFFFQDALERPEDFQEYVRSAAPVARFGTHGIGSADALPVDQEVHLGVKKLMSDTGMDYAKALREFLAANPGLGAQYRLNHTQRVNADGTAN